MGTQMPPQPNLPIHMPIASRLTRRRGALFALILLLPGIQGC